MRRSLSFVLAWGWLSTPAFATDADEWINRLIDAEYRQSYSGTFIHEKDGNLSTHAIWQQVGDGVSRERILQLDGAPAELARSEGGSVCMSDEMTASVGLFQVLHTFPSNLEALSRYYDFRLIGESRVAARPAVVLSVTAKDRFRHSLELHLDRDSALLLKSVLHDEQQRPLERLQFVSFNTSVVPAPSELASGAACKPLVPRSRHQASGWYSDWVPPGFQLLASDTAPDPSSGEPVTWLGYGDGLARFSIFLEPLSGAAGEEVTRQAGSTVTVSHRLSTRKGAVMATVLGDVPLLVAERVVWSMRYAGGVEP
ncbi:MucB/RseB C-terminal domain-containing protein [Pseudomonas sp. ABC1]|uniref:MucB/RseB C-terminal domain-containing protein n=1 Tax=Pseudomonas sp. ABC1 TaxID=2748080 RepID=UPI0015C40B98|nr:MucB/RseB C-terminal domain-containing protein [Pseudomonas sp. ABC1]QLF92240.1 MucB/RseB C-terminal domain-containing protein [Pseudomonas sp. ABC1]